MALLDTEHLEQLLTEADRLAVRLNGEHDDDDGLIAEIQLAVITLEDAIKDLGGAYEVESEAAQRLESGIAELRAIKNVGSDIIKEVEQGTKGVGETVSQIVHKSLLTEAESITEKLAEQLEARLNSRAESKIDTLLGQHYTEASVAELASKLHFLKGQLDDKNDILVELDQLRRRSNWLVPLATIGGASIMLLAGLVYAIGSGLISIAT